MTRRTTSRRFTAFAAVAALVLLLPGSVAAHAELEASAPDDGETIVGQPAGMLINARYNEQLDPEGSSLNLVDANGDTIASGGVSASGDYPFEMWVEDLPELAPGVYTVRSTTKSVADGDVDRTTWTFTIVAPTGTPTPIPTAACTDECAPGSPIATAAPTPLARDTAEPSLTDTGAPAASTADAILPVIAGLAIVLVGAGYLLSRRGRPSGPA